MHKITTSLPKTKAISAASFNDRKELVISALTGTNTQAEIVAGLAAGSRRIYPAELLSIFRQLATSGLTYRSWRINYLSGNPFYSYLLLLVLLGRFFGKKITIAYYNYNDLDRLEVPNMITRWLFRQVEKLIVLSEYQQQRLRKYNVPVFVEPVIPLTEPVAATRSNRLQPHLVSVLPAEQTSNLTTLIDAYTMVKEKYPRTELTVIAEGTLFSRFTRFFKRNNYPGITFLRYSEVTIRTAFENADLYVQSSHLRNLSAGLLTALNSGLPVITTPPGYDPAIDSSSHLIITDANSAGGMADMVIKLVEHEDAVGKLREHGARLGRILARRASQYYSEA